MSENRDNQLKMEEVLEQYQEEWMSSLPSDEELENMHTFSPEFENKMSKLINGQKKSKYAWANSIGKRVAVAAIITVVALSTTMFSAKARGIPVFKVVVQVFEKVTTISFNNDEKEKTKENETQPAPTIDHYYELSFLPKGYTLTTKDEFDGFVQMEYTNKAGEILLFEQMTIGQRKISIGSEGAKSEKVLINGVEGVFFSHVGFCKLVWHDKKYCYTIFGPIKKDVIIKMAESIQINEGEEVVK